MRGARLLALLMLPSCRGVRRLHADRYRSAQPLAAPPAAEISARGSQEPDLDLRRRLDAGSADRHARQREGQRLHRERAASGSASGRPGTRAAILQRVPLTSYAADSARATLRVGSGDAGAVDGLLPVSGAVRDPGAADQRLAAGVHRRPRGQRRHPVARGTAGQGRGLQQRVERQHARRAGPDTRTGGWD